MFYGEANIGSFGQHELVKKVVPVTWSKMLVKLRRERKSVFSVYLHFNLTSSGYNMYNHDNCTLTRT